MGGWGQTSSSLVACLCQAKPGISFRSSGMGGYTRCIVPPATLGVSNALWSTSSLVPSSQNFCEVPADPVWGSAVSIACSVERKSKYRRRKVQVIAEQKPGVLRRLRDTAVGLIPRGFSEFPPHRADQSMPRVSSYALVECSAGFGSCLNADICVFRLCAEYTFSPFAGKRCCCEHHSLQIPLGGEFSILVRPSLNKESTPPNRMILEKLRTIQVTFVLLQSCTPKASEA